MLPREKGSSPVEHQHNPKDWRCLARVSGDPERAGEVCEKCKAAEAARRERAALSLRLRELGS